MILVGTATQNGTAPCCGAEMDGEDTLVEEMGGEHSSAKQMDGENSSVGDRIRTVDDISVKCENLKSFNGHECGQKLPK